MSTIVLNWTPALASSSNFTGQRAKASAIVNNNVPSMVDGFNPPNILSKTAFSTQFITALPNIVYAFTVESICLNNGPAVNTNGIQEQIVFSCVFENVKAGAAPEVTNTSYTPRIVTHVNTDVHGTNYPNGISSIIGVIFYLYKDNNTVLVEGPVAVNVLTGTSLNQGYEYAFLGLQPGVEYTLRYALVSTIKTNGAFVQVRSDSAAYLNSFCLRTITTTNTNTSTCSIYDINNQGATSADYTYTPCTSTIPMTSTIPATGRFSVCAEKVELPASKYKQCLLYFMGD